MTDLLDEALRKVRRWPQTRQDDAARLLIAMHEQNRAEYALTAEQIARIKLSKERADTGDFVPDDEVDAFFAKHAHEN